MTDLNSRDYVRAQAFIDRLNKVRYMLTTQEILALRKQALHGDVSGASEALNKMVIRFYETNTNKLYVERRK